MIRIVADSTCDLPEELVKKFNIEIIPLYINFGDKGYLDGTEISRQEFYERMPDASPLPTTATPGVDMFRRLTTNLPVMVPQRSYPSIFPSISAQPWMSPGQRLKRPLLYR